MSFKFGSIVIFSGIDTTGSACSLTTVNRSPTGPNAHDLGQVLGQVLDLANGNDISQQFTVTQAWQDSTDKVAQYGIMQLSGFNNSGKTLIATFLIP